MANNYVSTVLSIRWCTDLDYEKAIVCNDFAFYNVLRPEVSGLEEESILVEKRHCSS